MFARWLNVTLGLVLVLAAIFLARTGTAESSVLLGVGGAVLGVEVMTFAVPHLRWANFALGILLLVAPFFGGAQTPSVETLQRVVGALLMASAFIPSHVRMPFVRRPSTV